MAEDLGKWWFIWWQQHSFDVRLKLYTNNNKNDIKEESENLCFADFGRSISTGLLAYF